MTFTDAEFATFSQCGHRYKLTSIESVPHYPATRQLVSRIVRDAIQAELRAHHEPQQTRQLLERLTTTHLGSDVSLTELEASHGNRWVFEQTLKSATRLFGLWRAVVLPKVAHTHLNRPYELSIGGATITGRIEIQEATQIRATRVRSKRPAAGEAALDYRLIFAAIAAGVEGVEVNFLIDTEKLAVDRQEFCLTEAQVESARLRVDAMRQSIESGCFLPSDSSSWKCLACQLRPVCKYV